MAKSSSPVSGIAERYAGSLYELAVQSNTVDQVEADLSRFEALLSESDDLSRMIKSPVFLGRGAVQGHRRHRRQGGDFGLVGNFLSVVAKNRRLFALPAMIKAFRVIAADASRRGFCRRHLGPCSLTAAQEE